MSSVGLSAYKHLSLMLVGRVQAYSNTCSAIAAQLQHNCSIFAAHLPTFLFDFIFSRWSFSASEKHLGIDSYVED